MDRPQLTVANLASYKWPFTAGFPLDNSPPHMPSSSAVGPQRDGFVCSPNVLSSGGLLPYWSLSTLPSSNRRNYCVPSCSLYGLHQLAMVPGCEREMHPSLFASQIGIKQSENGEFIAIDVESY